MRKCLENTTMVTEEIDKKQKGKVKWNPIQTGQNLTNSTATTSTQVDIDTTGWETPTQYDFKAPGRPKFEYDKDAGILSLFKPKEPVYDQDREDRVKRVARLNAFGDFVKHLGAFAGGGYAPTEKRKENKNVMRAFAELDKMRDVYEAKKGKYDDQLLGLQAQDYVDQRNRTDKEYDRDLALRKDAYDKNYQAEENLRLNKMKAHIENNTKRTSRQNSETDQFKNLDLLLMEQEVKKKAGAGKDENFYAYIKGVGDLKINKSAQIQVGTRIKDAMLNAGLINEKDAAGLMAALSGPNSRTAFQSLLGYLRYPDVYDACKQFFGHGIELLNPEKEGLPLDNEYNKTSIVGGQESSKSSSGSFDYSKMNY